MNDVVNAQISYSNENRIVGSLVRYQCDTGYMIEGPETRTCLADGTWSLTDPTCSELLYCIVLPP